MCIVLTLDPDASGPPACLHALQMLQLVNHLRRCGYFVAVALTRPFTFEGARKLEQADALIEAMEDVAAMVVSGDGGACRSFAGKNLKEGLAGRVAL